MINSRSSHFVRSRTTDIRRRIVRRTRSEIQQDQIRPWTQSRSGEIIHEFMDPGKSGLTAEGRPGFQDMMENWVKKRNDFKYILCLDVSRWGRFQDIDLSAQYSAECRKYGKEVIYTKIGMPREDDPFYSVYIQFERFRAAEYSRELSDKVFRGCVKIAQQGYWAGGKPRYGFRRLLLNEARQPVQILQPGERKGIQNQRVTLALGDEREVAVIRRIFHEFTDGGRHEQAIADGLNHDGIPSPGGSTWDGTKVRDILIDERYTGTMVYNRTSQKLKTPSRANPKEEWIRTPESFERIIEPVVFARAQQIFAERARVHTPAYMLEKLETFYQAHGILRSSLVRVAPDMPWESATGLSHTLIAIRMCGDVHIFRADLRPCRTYVATAWASPADVALRSHCSPCDAIIPGGGPL